tara:strand:- start:234 stop:518 length:285 start_codon:yes stop_codon:yes gene_type:complete
MGFRGRYKNKRDANEAEIIEQFKVHGFSVYPLDQPLDLLVGYMGRNYLIEVKMPKGNLTDAQVQFLDGWRGSANIIRTTEEATEFVVLVKGRDA